MVKNIIKYDELIEDSMRDLVKKLLFQVQRDGLQNSHHFLLYYLNEQQADLIIHTQRLNACRVVF